MADSTTKLTIELQTVLRNLNRTLRGLDQIKKKLDSIAAVRFNQRSSTAATDRQTIAAQRLAIQQERLRLAQERLKVQTQELANRQERARQTAERLARSNDRLTQSVQRGSRVLPQLQQRLNSVGAAALRVGGGLRSVGASAAILVSGPLVALGTIAARSAADIDSIRNRLIATEGSLEVANARLDQLRRLADQSIGVTRRAALDAFATLSVVGDVTEETINRQILAMGRLNAAFTIDDQQQFFRNLIQIFTQGFERADIKEALGRVPIFEQLLAQAFGTADREKLRELKAAGKLTLDSFLLGIAEAVNQDPVLAGVGESIRVRFAKMVERIQDSLEPLGLAILGPLERIVRAVEPIILRVSAAFARLPEGVQTAIVAVGILTAALGPVLFILGGIASGVGALATALAAMLPVLSSIGLPALLAILGGLVVVITTITGVVTTLGVAWKTNFLGIRKLVSDAANAVVNAFNRIREVFDEAIRRTLPTLQSLTTKVVEAITAIWEKYGSTVVQVVGAAFRFITDVTVVFLRLFTDFVDLVAKLIDNDWRGAWNAFARIVISILDNAEKVFVSFVRGFNRLLLRLTAFIIRQGIAFAQAGSRLAVQLLTALAVGLIAGAPQIRNALAVMLIAAVAGVAFGPIAEFFVARLLAELRRAASEGLPQVLGPNVSEPPELSPSLRPRKPRRKVPATVEEEDEKTKNILRRQLDRMREAQDKLDEARAEGALNEFRARIEREFDATKAGLEREERALGDSFEDRLVSIKNYLAKRGELEDAQIEAEIQKESELSSALFRELSARRRAADREFETELKEIAEDPRLKGEARQAATITAQLKRAAEIEKAISDFKIKNEDITANIAELEKRRKENADVRLRFERLLTEELGKQQVQIRADLLEQQGRTADAEALRLKARFTETLRDLRIDTTTLGVDLQDALNKVDLSVLQQRLDDLPEPIRTLIELLDIGIKRAAIVEAQQLVDDLSAGLRLEEERVQNRVLDGLINQRQAQAEIVALQQKQKGLLLDILAGELKRAKEIKDQGLIIAIQAQIEETERLGRAIDEAGQRINQALFSDLQSGLSGIFSGARKGFEGLRDAAISFGERLLDTLNDIAATSILERIEGLFKPDATNTEGTVGGFISKLFGLQPKQAADAATASATLQAGATTAAATITTGAATAGTTFGASVVTAATSFASLIITAGAAFAAAVAASSTVQAIGGAGGGAGSLLAGAASGGLFSAVPGGMVHILEGGHSEAVLTTDPKYFPRQLEILKAYIRETRGLGGRIKSFAAGAMISPSEAQSMMFSGISAPLPAGDVGSMVVASAPSETRLRQILVDQRSYRDWLMSSEGEEVVVDILYKNQPVIRKIGGGRK